MREVGEIERRESDDGYHILLREWELEPGELGQLQQGGNLVVAVAAIGEPVPLLQVVAPECSCGERMEWNEQLKTYCCAHNEREGSTDVGTQEAD